MNKFVVGSKTGLKDFSIYLCSSDPIVLEAVKELSDYLTENGDLVFYDLSEALRKVSSWFAKSVGLYFFHLGNLMWHPSVNFSLALLAAGTPWQTQLLYMELVEALELHQTKLPTRELALLLQPWCLRIDSSCLQNGGRPACLHDLVFATIIEGLSFAHGKCVDRFIFTKYLFSSELKSMMACFQDWFFRVGGGREYRIMSFFREKATLFDETTPIRDLL